MTLKQSQGHQTSIKMDTPRKFIIISWQEQVFCSYPCVKHCHAVVSGLQEHASGDGQTVHNVHHWHKNFPVQQSSFQMICGLLLKPMWGRRLHNFSERCFPHSLVKALIQTFRKGSCFCAVLNSLPVSVLVTSGWTWQFSKTTCSDKAKRFGTPCLGQSANCLDKCRSNALWSISILFWSPTGSEKTGGSMDIIVVARTILLDVKLKWHQCSCKQCPVKLHVASSGAVEST